MCLIVACSFPCEYPPTVRRCFTKKEVTVSEECIVNMFVSIGPTVRALQGRPFQFFMERFGVDLTVVSFEVFDNDKCRVDPLVYILNAADVVE